MDHHSFGYSMKCVLIPSEQEYDLDFLDSCHKFDIRMRWRAFHFLNPNQSKNDKKTFGLNTSQAPPAIKELKSLQDGLVDIAINLKFKRNRNHFQNKLRADLKDIKNDKNVYVAADKTRNFYKMSKENYSQFLNNNITKDYKKADESTINDITKDDKKVATELEIDDRMYCTAKRDTFITLKDHKKQFMNNPKFRVINPTKSELGMISKQMLSEIITTVKSKSHFVQWKNSDATIDWFMKLENKSNLRFLQFDVVDFYASISPQLLENSLAFAASYMPISKITRDTILQATNSFLFSDKQAWVKNQGGTFDITMGGYHGAEVCDLVGLFLLSQLTQVIPASQIGLYRDDGLCVSSATPRQLDIIRKKICKIFEQNNLKVTTEANSKVINFLDVTFDLSTGLYKPYMKENDQPLYVDINSNHPPLVLKSIPQGVNRRLCKISANKEIFDAARQPYQEALNRSGYNHTLEYTPPLEFNTKKKNRKRSITWFNPPFSLNVRTNIGKEFLNLLDRAFPPDNPLSKLFNRQTVKISYKRMPNMAQAVAGHNTRVLSCLLYTSPSPRDGLLSRMPSSA